MNMTDAVRIPTREECERTFDCPTNCGWSDVDVIGLHLHFLNGDCPVLEEAKRLDSTRRFAQLNTGGDNASD